MKNRLSHKLLALVLAAVLLSALVSACGGAVTPEGVFRTVAEKLEDVTSTSVTIEANIEADVGIGTPLLLEIAMDGDITKEPVAMYATGDLKMDMGEDYNMESEIETYTVEEDGSFVTYSMQDGGGWMRTEAEAPDMDLSSGFAAFESIADKFTVTSEDAVVNGEKCVELQGVLTLREFSDAFNVANYGGADFSSVFEELDGAADGEIETVISVYQKSQLPARVTFDLRGMKPETEEDVTFEKFLVSVTYNEFNSVSDIRVPADVVASAIDEGSEDLFDDMEDDFIDDGSDTYVGDIWGFETTGAAEQLPQLGSSWNDYQVELEGTVLTLPCTYADLEKIGYTLDTDYAPENGELYGKDYDYNFFDKPDTYGYIGVMIYNPSEETKPLEECLVFAIDFDAYSVLEGVSGTLPGGIKVGESTRDEVIAAYGEPHMTDEGDTYTDLIWYDGDDYFYQYVKVVIDEETGLVDSIDISNLK